MAMKMTLNEFLGTEEIEEPSADVIAAKMALDVQADAFLRMKKLGIKQKDLAAKMGVSAAAVSKLLTNGSNMRLSSIARVASALGCDVTPPKFVPFGAQASKESSSTLSSGMTVTLTVHHEQPIELKAERDKHDPIDDEYRKLCVHAKEMEGMEALGDVALESLDDLFVAGVAS